MRSECRSQIEITTVEIFNNHVNDCADISNILHKVCAILRGGKNVLFFPRLSVAFCICCQILPSGPLPAH